MINFHTVITAFTKQLNDDADVSAIATVIAGEYVNEDFNRTPWIGVYRGKVKYEPRTLGYDNWEAYPSIKVIVQASSTISGEDCEDKLEGYIKKVISAISADKTIAGNVDMLNSMDVEYGYVETDRNSLYFQSAIITFDMEVAT